MYKNERGNIDIVLQDSSRKRSWTLPRACNSFPQYLHISVSKLYHLYWRHPQKISRSWTLPGAFKSSTQYVNSSVSKTVSTILKAPLPASGLYWEPANAFRNIYTFLCLKQYHLYWRHPSRSWTLPGCCKRFTQYLSSVVSPIPILKLPFSNG